jgi:hypothetical protein
VSSCQLQWGHKTEDVDNPLVQSAEKNVPLHELSFLLFLFSFLFTSKTKTLKYGPQN